MNPEAAVPTNGSLDGDGAGDHDLPYRFGLRPNVESPFPFSTRQFARLLVLRARIDAEAEAEVSDDRRAA